MITLLLATLAAPFLIGYLAFRAFTPELTPARTGSLVQVFLGAGCGVGLLSLLYFVIRTAGGPLTAYWIGEGLLLAASAAGCWSTSRKPRPRTPANPSHAPNRLLAIVFLAILAGSALSFLHAARASPFGDWDAWAIWNLRAKFLAQQDAGWLGAVSQNLRELPGNVATHPDYPLLLSGYVGRTWALTGSIGATVVPAAVGGLFWSATIAVLVGALAQLRGWNVGMLGGLVLLSNAAFALNAPTQYADVPLGFFYLSTFAILLIAGTQETPDRYMGLAGFTAGCAAWTKDEGLLFGAALSAALFVCTVLRKVSPRRFGLFLAGSLAPLAATLYLKWFLVTADATWAPVTLTSVLHHLAEPARYRQILSALAKEASSMGTGLIGLALLAGLGISRRQLRTPLVAALLGTCGIMLVGLFAVYLVTPLDLNWHLATSLGRVLTQQAPGIVFAIAACCGTDAEPEPKPKKGKNRSRQTPSVSPVA